MCEEKYTGRVHTEHAILDIGQDVGALILYTDETLHGKEIEVSPLGNDEQRTHTRVLERLFNGRRMFAALYLALPAASYTIWGDDAKPIAQVDVTGGQVAELTI